MSEDNNSKQEIKKEFKRFGENLKNAFNDGWNSEERHNFQSEISDGITQLGEAMNEFVTSFSASETGQKFISEVDDFGDRLRNGEVETKAREGLLTVLNKINEELTKASEHFSQTEDDLEDKE